jgi:hypothetical protein
MAVAAIIPIAMMAMTAATTAMGAMGAMAAGNAQQSAANYNAAMAMQAGTANAARQEQENRRKIAEARAAYGAAGVDEQGTPLEVLSDLATQGELDRQTILYNARTSAAESVWQGKQAKAEATGKAFGTILTGLGSMAGQGLSMMGGSTGAGSGMSMGIAYPSATATAHY